MIAGAMNPQQLGEVTYRVEILKTPLGLMSRPAWRAGPSCVVSEAPEKGPEVPSWSNIVGIPEAPQVWQLGPIQTVYLQVGQENGHL